MGWRNHVNAAREARAGGAPVHEVKYEALVAGPAATMRALFAFLGVTALTEEQSHHKSFDRTSGENESSADAVARPLNALAVGRWRQDLTRAEAQTVERIVGPLLARYGYAHAGR
ncbi:MAG: sulfotransferase domain-containing protein [Parvularculaceae bacterium]|nr:sulfotransferase domain-containing protein [Parvularculaceae bacterium]